MGNDPTKPVNPTFAAPLWRAALTDPSRTALLDPEKSVPKPGAPLRFEPPAKPTVEAARAEVLGPTWAALTGAWGDAVPRGDADVARAQAALGVVPALLLASAARPVTDRVYALLDRIPAAARRPFEKMFGLLVDSGLAAASGAAQSLLDASVRGWDLDGAPPPARVELPVESLSQLDTSCGETAVAMILKAAGEPVLLGDVDTQMSVPHWVTGAGGANLLVDAEFARRGLAAVSGVSDVEGLRRFVAAGMPVMVSVGWEGGGGHFAVVSGYDAARGTLRVENWLADGVRREVSAAEFDAAWARHLRAMTAVVPRRDPRLEKLLKSATPRRPDAVARGFSVTDFWCDPKRVYVEAAYRWVTPDTDLVVRVSFNSEGLDWAPAAQMRWLGGSLAVRQRVASGWYVGAKVQKLSLRKTDDEWTTLRALPLGASASLEGPGFRLAVAAERGAAQASLAVALGRKLADLGLEVSVSVTDQGTYAVSGVLAGAW